MEKALELLKTYTWGDNVTGDKGVFGKELKPLDDAIVDSAGDEDARKEIEEKLIGILKGDASADGKNYVCRLLKFVGTDASVPTLSSMLGDDKHSHMARYALQSIPGDVASKALIDAVGALSGKLKAGVIGSLGARGDNGAVSKLANLLGDKDNLIATSAAKALGAIRTKDAAKALSDAKPNEEVAAAVIDSTLSCAEGLLAAGDKTGALAIYKSLKGNPAKHIKLAATRGMLACAGSSK